MSVVERAERAPGPRDLVDPLTGAWAVIATLALLWALLSWASGGVAISEEHARLTAAEIQIAGQATRIAVLVGTPEVYCWQGPVRVRC